VAHFSNSAWLSLSIAFSIAFTAEELFACGCHLLISITSAGQIISLGRPPYVALIEKALRDEGTSYHYQSPSHYSYLHPVLRDVICRAWDHTHVPLHTGASWTTDAPFRETEKMIAACRKQGILAVEMEAAALYALANAKQYEIVCFAHVTNQMGQTEGDFEKGETQGAQTSLHIMSQTAHHWRQSRLQVECEMSASLARYQCSVLQVIHSRLLLEPTS
jgi:uridine phosphorylase